MMGGCSKERENSGKGYSARNGAKGVSGYWPYSDLREGGGLEGENKLKNVILACEGGD